ncbi:hypothetical protein A675_04087 [Salmonella enterica subsp. enterica serovar Enteritidis str. 2009K1726]|nr:hypothetical protein A675_04087 [Salmonella enterica subsp. enterica serovar Enteritidis str. 2009K1726]
MQNEPQTASIPVRFAKLYREANDRHERILKPAIVRVLSFLQYRKIFASVIRVVKHGAF